MEIAFEIIFLLPLGLRFIQAIQNNRYGIKILQFLQYLRQYQKRHRLPELLSYQDQVPFVKTFEIEPAYFLSGHLISFVVKITGYMFAKANGFKVYFNEA